MNEVNLYCNWAQRICDSIRAFKQLGISDTQKISSHIINTCVKLHNWLNNSYCLGFDEIW